MGNAAATVTIERSEYDFLLNAKSRIVELEALVKWYENQLLSAKRRLFGSSSEKTDVDFRQLALFGEAVAPEQPVPETEEIAYKRKKRRGKREEDLSDLPVERINYELPESGRICPDCGDIMRDVGVRTRRELKLIPAKVVVLEHAAHTYACRNCAENGERTPFLKAQAPKALIAGSLASPSLVAYIAAQKYCNGMPLCRLEKGFSYDGVTISRQTMANWVIQCSERYLEPLCEVLKRHLLAENALHSDETPVQVLREPGRAATTKSYEWVYRTSGCSKHKIVVYEYKQTRSGEHLKKFLKDFKGLLHTDGYQAYHNLPPGITVIGCWAHVRRKFEDILKKIPGDRRKGTSAETGVAYINALFSLERKFSGLPPKERYEKRLEKSKPIADAFFEWAASLGALPKSPIGGAVHYALSQRKYLENVFLDGCAEVSNNRAERSVKPFVMGRKAWLFSNTPAGAAASSVMYTLIETAKENGLHPYRYLEFLLETLSSNSTLDLETLLPWNDTLPETCRVQQTKKETHTNGKNEKC